MMLPKRRQDRRVKICPSEPESLCATLDVTQFVIHRFAHPLTDTSRTNRL
jgi:hypothetical protein